MIVEDIEKLIKGLNENHFNNVFLEILTNTVEYGVAWLEVIGFDMEKGKHYTKYPHEFYFIKNNSEEYVAAVHVMKINDLHWFVLPNHRKKGILTTALKNIILPHLLSTKKSQNITIDIDDIGNINYENSKKVALQVGFRQISERTFSISSDKVAIFDESSIRKKGMDYSQLEKLFGKISDVERSFDIIEDEVKYKLGNSDEIISIRKNLLSQYKREIEHIYSEYKRNN